MCWNRCHNCHNRGVLWNRLYTKTIQPTLQSSHMVCCTLSACLPVLVGALCERLILLLRQSLSVELERVQYCSLGVQHKLAATVVDRVRSTSNETGAAKEPASVNTSCPQRCSTRKVTAFSNDGAMNDANNRIARGAIGVNQFGRIVRSRDCLDFKTSSQLSESERKLDATSVTCDNGNGVKSNKTTTKKLPSSLSRSPLKKCNTAITQLQQFHTPKLQDLNVTLFQCL